MLLVVVLVYITGPRPQLPIEGPWRHASLKGFLKNVDAGKEETGKSPGTDTVTIMPYTVTMFMKRNTPSDMVYLPQDVRLTVRLTE